MLNYTDNLKTCSPTESFAKKVSTAGVFLCHTPLVVATGELKLAVSPHRKALAPQPEDAIQTAIWMVRGEVDFRAGYVSSYASALR
jgi:hypothetical protein